MGDEIVTESGKGCEFIFITNAFRVFYPASIGKLRGHVPMLTKGNTALQIFFWNTQLISVIISYVLLSTESESEISFAPLRLDFAACEGTIFGKQ